jgi:glucose 1-dehydrogenase
MEDNHPFTLTGRTALVTGSSRGIGAEIAKGLARAGANVVVHCNEQGSKANEVAAIISSYGVRSSIVRKDIGVVGAPAELIREAANVLGPIDILVLNASVQIPHHWLSITRDEFEKQVAINFRSSLELLQLTAPGMMERKWGRIISIGSVQETKPHPDMLVYSSLKNAQTAMIRSLARQLASYGITSNNIAPGVILTDRNASRLADEIYAEKVRGNIPSGFLGMPQDCAGAILLLCSDEGRYITGQNIYIDGGMSL